MTLTFDLGGHRDCRSYASWYFVRVPSSNFGDTTTILFVFDLWAIAPTRPCDLDIWPWRRSWRLWLMRVIVFYPCTKFEVRRPWHLEDMAHDVCQH